MNAKRILLYIILIGVTINMSAKIRKLAVAGMWYPENKTELENTLKKLFDSVTFFDEEENINPFGMIVPHAGYAYSGEVAAYNFSLLNDKHFDTVILLGTSHHYLENVVSIYDGDYYQTPLGEVEIDREITGKIIETHKRFVFREYVHTKEHSIESQIPFLQYQLSNFKIVPILTSTHDLLLLNELAETIAKIIKKSDKKILMVCSTDMSHFHDYQFAQKMDKYTIDLILNKSQEELKHAILNGSSELCGYYALNPFLKILKVAYGIEQGKLLKYANSGDAMGDFTSKSVVGYCSIVYQKKVDSKNEFLSDIEKEYLLNLARKSITYYEENGKHYSPELPASDILQKDLAVFVTLNKDSSLRGCIGQMIAREPLYLAVNNMAVSAAFEDFRFNRVTSDELENIDIEISVLTPLEKIYDYKQIKMGIDGVWIRKGRNNGVFLPQVATETGWNQDTFLENLCEHKAHLPKDAYKDKDTEIYIFQVLKFSE